MVVVVVVVVVMIAGILVAVVSPSHSFHSTWSGFQWLVLAFEYASFSEDRLSLDGIWDGTLIAREGMPWQCCRRSPES